MIEIGIAHEKGKFIAGNKAFGCEDYKLGCKTIIPFEMYGKKLTKTQINQLVKKGESSTIKGFKIDGVKKEGKLKFDSHFSIYLEEVKP